MSLRCPSPRIASNRPKSSSSAAPLRLHDPDTTVFTQKSNQYPFQGLPTPHRRHISTAPTESPRRRELVKSSNNNWVQNRRPMSPVAMTPAIVVNTLTKESHPTIKPTDLTQIQAWLESLEHEAASFTSYFLFCEVKFQETTVLATGKETPNHLRTAVALYCLQQATSIFGRYQNILTTICTNLGNAIYKDFEALVSQGQKLTAAHYYTKGVTYFDHVKNQDQELVQLKEKISTLEHENRRLDRKLKLAQTNFGTSSSENDATKKSSNSHQSDPAAMTSMGNMEKVRTILSMFKTLEMSSKKMILMGLLQMVENPLDADAMADAIQYMKREEAQKLTYQLAAEYGHTVSSMVHIDPQNVKILKTFESKEVIEAERATYEQLILLRNELNHAKETYMDDIRHERDRNEILTDELKDLMSRYHELSRQVPTNKDTAEQAVQTEEKVHTINAIPVATESKPAQETLRFQGISELIADANFLPKHVKKIFAKRKPMVVQELCKTIASIYQAKMLQDIQDDVNCRPRESLIEFMHDLYVLYHGLKGLAIGQFICIDTGVRKFCEKNARVRVFGMLLGSSAQPCVTYKSIGATHQAVDFYLYVVGLIFKSIITLVNKANFDVVGHYIHQTEDAMESGRHLAEMLGDGIVGSPNATCIPLLQALEVIEAAFAFDTTSDLDDNPCYLAIKHLTDESIEIDMFLELVMRQWFKLFNQQVDFMHTLFESLDYQQNGILEFPVFQLLATQLDPQMHERDILAMYTKVANADNVIDADAFVMGVIQHQQRVMAAKHTSFRRQKSVNNRVFTRTNSQPRAPATMTSKEITNARRGNIVELSYNIVSRLRSLSLKAINAPLLNVEQRNVRGSISTENWNVSIDDIIARRTRPVLTIEEDNDESNSSDDPLE
ncbi:hypothetical protein THRCLA_02156 [Thraustotheca clavata]|uniref:EF-hand domain-containing protein n=1 Tax=Thraustotheca clavata TaxID=74557 RepID=A0A1W0A633_9STRA|nr:hypothetical protein THRCLA_02156 [Thraustotheca clavata]